MTISLGTQGLFDAAWMEDLAFDEVMYSSAE